MTGSLLTYTGRALASSRYCSANVQLTKAQPLQGLSLLQPLTLSDLSGKPDKLLAVEDLRIAELAMSTRSRMARDRIKSRIQIGTRISRVVLMTCKGGISFVYSMLKLHTMI
jgi:hypothetical protein